MTTPQNPIRIEDKEYQFEDLSPEGQNLVQHMISVDDKLNRLAFEVQQAQITRQAVYTQLLSSVEPKEDLPNDEEETGIPEEPPAS